MTIKNVNEETHLHIWGIRYDFTEDFVKEKIYVVNVNFTKVLKNQENILLHIKYRCSTPI